ncbi:MAG: hypothetical protein P1V20_00100 [Verrucomicrobiales bacterium]|nr:hypothetical protein [Verrucomicrobiales bacterium]
MKIYLLLFGVCCLLFSPIAGTEPLAKKGKLLFSDDFERTDLGSWKVIIPGFRVEDGVLKGTQDRADHGSVGRVYLPMKDVVMTFRFNLTDSPTFNVVFDDKNLKEYSHAGHVCRVAFAKKQIRLGDDKEGIMRNDIFEMRRNPETKKEADALIKDRGIAVKANLEANRWYQAMIEISGDEMRVHLDGELIGTLKSPGIAHPTKESVHFTVTGKEIRFDDVVIHEAVKK